MMTVMSHRLGPVNRWEDVLELVAGQNFNAIHYSPLQVLGESKSAYSIADQLQISKTFTDQSWEGVAQTIDQIRKKYGLLAFSDLVLNHTASNSPWLPSDASAGYNEITAPWLNAAIELDTVS